MNLIRNQQNIVGKMFSCPLCCTTTFNSKELLIDHLTQITKNVVCSICKAGTSSIDDLIEHLKFNCIETIVFCEEDSQNQVIQQSEYHIELTNNDMLQENCNNNGSVVTEHILEDNHVNSLYSDILSKQHVQELKLVKECGDRYVLIDSNDAVVSKQNEDGTVSFTIEESRTTETLEIDQINEYSTKVETENADVIDDVEDSQQEEIYSCNTCGVTFTSVIDHIQTFHNDQDVVVEEPIDAAALSEEYQQLNEKAGEDRQMARRMITDTGDIVEEPLQQTVKRDQEVVNKQDNLKPLKTKRRYIKIGKVTESVINNNIKNALEESNGSYHNVAMKIIEAPNGNKVKVYSCVLCNFLVSSLAEFKQHPCNTRASAAKYKCSVCSISYDNAKSLCAHMKVHKEKPDPNLASAPPKFECEICSTRFPTSKSLKLHKRMHDPIKPRPIQPPVETSQVADKFLCGVCLKVIPLHYRAVHQNSHKGSGELTCDLCNKKFPTREYLDMHMNVHNMYKVAVEKQENDSLPYQCLYCERKFARPHEKVKHERIHTGEKPHSCEICGKSFRVSYCLTLHMRTHTGARPYECPHCPKRFKAHSVYNHHILTHSEVRAYKCPYCPKAFKTSVQLAGHKNSHTKPFSCQQCNRPFASLYAVRVHMEVHGRQNSLKFKCTECGASYARAFALKDHVRQAHSHLEPAVPDNTANSKGDQWKTKDIHDSVEIETRNKESPSDMNEIGISSEELIIS